MPAREIRLNGRRPFLVPIKDEDGERGPLASGAHHIAYPSMRDGGTAVGTSAPLATAAPAAPAAPKPAPRSFTYPTMQPGGRRGPVGIVPDPAAAGDGGTRATRTAPTGHPTDTPPGAAQPGEGDADQGAGDGTGDEQGSQGVGAEHDRQQAERLAAERRTAADDSPRQPPSREQLEALDAERRRGMTA